MSKEGKWPENSNTFSRLISSVDVVAWGHIRRKRSSRGDDCRARAWVWSSWGKAAAADSIECAPEGRQAVTVTYWGEEQCEGTTEVDDVDEEGKRAGTGCWLRKFARARRGTTGNGESHSGRDIPGDVAQYTLENRLQVSSFRDFTFLVFWFSNFGSYCRQLLLSQYTNFLFCFSSFLFSDLTFLVSLFSIFLLFVLAFFLLETSKFLERCKYLWL